MAWLILSKQREEYNSLNEKVAKNLMAHEKCMSFIRVLVFHGVWRNLQGLCKMALINVLAFLVLKILHNLVFVQKPLFANNY